MSDDLERILFPVPAHPPDESDFAYPEFNEGWTPVIVGLLENIRDSRLWDSPPSDIIEQIDELIDRLQDMVAPVPQVYPQSISFSPLEAQVLHGNALALVADAAQYAGYLIYQNTAAVNDEAEIKFIASAGNYTLNWIVATGNNRGIMGFAFDGGSPNGVDQYHSTTQHNIVGGMNFSLSTDGIHTLNMKVANKNGSSSGYYWTYSLLWIVKV